MWISVYILSNEPLGGNLNHDASVTILCLKNRKYDEIKQNNDIPHPPAYDRLTPAQFMEVQKYMADPDYQVVTTAWE